MDPINPHRESNEPDDAGLDALLAQARWPEPSEASTRRLAAAWAGVSPARRDGRWRFVAAAAAAIAIVSGVVAMVVLRNGPATISTPPIAIAPQPPPLDVAVETSHAAPVLYVADWREPNARERLAMCDAKPRHRRAVKPHVTAKASPALTTRIEWSPRPAPPVTHNAPVSLQGLLEKVANPRTRSAALASLDAMSEPPVEALLNEMLSNRKAALRFAAARALGRINGPATTAALIDLVERDVRRREAVAALLCCTKDRYAAAYVAEAREAPELRSAVQSASAQLKHF